jgi:hypothetical protein
LEAFEDLVKSFKATQRHLKSLHKISKAFKWSVKAFGGLGKCIIKALLKAERQKLT